MPRFPNLDPSELLEAARRFALSVPAVAPALARRSDDAITELLVGGLATAAATVLDRVKDIQRPAYEVLADRACPWLRRPIPATTIVAFEPPSQGRYVVRASTELPSAPLDGVACRFRPTRDVTVAAFQAESAQLEVRRGRPTVFRFVLRSTGGEPINEAVSQGMALYVDGDRDTALDILFALTAEATQITVEGGAETAHIEIDPSRVTRAELDAASALAPDPDGPPATFHAFIEAAVCPDKFRFFRLPEMASLRAATPTHRVIISFRLKETSLLEARIRPGDIRAHCTPAVNLFEADAEPVSVDTEHPARPLRVAGLPRRGGGIYTVRSGIATSRGGEHPPVPLPDVRRLTAAPADPRCPIVFAISAEERDDGDPDIAVTFGEGAASATPDATQRVAAFRLLATNRGLASRVRAGDLKGELQTESGAARYLNLTPASPYVPPPTGDALRLRVLRAARITEGARDPLGALQDALFQAIPSWVGREEWVRAQHLRIRALDQLEVAPARRLDPDGAVQRGYGYRVVVDEAAFRGPGDLAILGATLGAAFARAVPVGTFAELRLEGRRGTLAATFGEPGEMMRDLQARLAMLAERVRSASSQVSLFPLVNRLERWLSPGVPIGGDEPAERERVHFTHTPDFNHAAAEVVDLTVTKESEGPSVTLRTTLLGLLGTESPLPELLSEKVLLGDDEGAQQAFFDVFQHRLLSLFYRLWRRYSVVHAFDGSGDDALSKRLQSFVGIDAFAPAPVRAMDPLFSLGLSDLSRCEPAFLDTAALEEMLRRLFPELGARVVPAEARPVRAEPGDMTLLGEAHSLLGIDYAYGDEALDPQGFVRIAIGPVSRAIYEELLPGGARNRALRPLLDEWLASRARVELEIHLASTDAPSFTLGEAFGGGLGVDSRLADAGARVLRVRLRLTDDPNEARPTYHET